jgi:hypothetical protein
MTRRRASPEAQIQRAVVAHLKARGAPGLVWTHVPLGGYRKPVEASILKGLGTRAGVSDLLLWHRGRAFALELKAEGGKPSEAQMQFISDLNAAGGFACIASGIDEAIRTLECWGLLRGTAS